MGHVIDLVDWYSEVLAEDPNSEVFAPLAEALYMDGRWEEAAMACHRGLAGRPNHLRGRVILGLALLRLDRVEEGRRELERTLWDIERNAELYHALAEIASNEGRKDEAERLLAIHRNMQPEHALAMLKSLPPLEAVRLSPGTGDQAQTPAAKPGERGAITPPSSSIEVFLDLLLQQTEGKPAALSEPITFFEDEERQILRRLLTQGPGGGRL